MVVARLVLVAVLARAFDLQAEVARIAEATAKTYGCEIAVAVESPVGSFSATSSGADLSSNWVWGSVTKTVTGATVLRHVEAGRVSLDESAATLLDPQLAKLGLGSMTRLFGVNASRVTVRHLATMRSGVPDYDTAKPYPLPATDEFRRTAYAAPAEEFGPFEILNQSYVATGRLERPPGSQTSYSSTNFVLLGLLLCELESARCSDWSAFDQKSVFDALSPAARAAFATTHFAALQSPAAAAAVDGFDRTDYNGQNATALPGVAVASVKGVFAGWTASDLVAPAADVARFAYALWGRNEPHLLNATTSEIMVPREDQPFYGFATFNFTLHELAGDMSSTPLRRTAYGHMGATYGYDSFVAYWPAVDVAIAVASNIETEYQVQPTDAVCHTIRAVFAQLDGAETAPTCSFERSGYRAVCSCAGDDDDAHSEALHHHHPKTTRAD